MDPISMMMMGGSGLQGIGSIFGAMNSSKTNKTNQRIAQQMFDLRQQERQDTIRAAEQARSDARLGSTDARGNRVRWDDQRGWVTELSEIDRILDALNAKEQQAQLTADIPQRRRQAAANERQQIEEGATARSLMDEFRTTRRESPEELRALLMDRARLGINEGADATQSQAMKQALRTGNSNTGAIVEAMAKSRGKLMQEASLDADIKSRTMADTNYNQKRSNTASLYAMFGDRASKLPNVAYNPATVGPQSSQALQSSMSQDTGANTALIKAFGTVGGTLDYQQPDMGWANAISSIGEQISGMGSQRRADDRYASAIDLARQRMNRGSVR